MILCLVFWANNSKLSEFLLKTTKFIYQWGKKNNCNSNRNNYFFLYLADNS